MNRRVRAAELGVLVLALGLRVAGLHSLSQTPYATHPLVDAYTYWDQAKDLLAGKDPFSDGFYQPPAYPVFLWLLSALRGAASLDAVRWVQAAMGVVSTALVIRLGRRAGGAWAGALAGLLFTLSPSVLLFEEDILTPALSIVLTLGGLALLSDAQRPNPVRAAGAGLLLGLAAEVHPTGLALAAMVGLWLGVGLFAAETRAASLRAALPYLGALALALSPTAWRNAEVYHQPALISHNGGINFYLGNNPDWKQTLFLRPGLPFRKLALDADPSQRDVAQRDAYWWARSEAEIAAWPGIWLEGLATRTLWSINNREIPRNEDYRCRTKAGPLAWIGGLPGRYGLLFPLAVLGGWLLWRRGGPSRLAPLAWAALHAPLLLFLVADRYRVATWPLVCVAAATAIAALIEARRSEQLRGYAWALLLVPLPWVPLDPVTDLDPSWCLHIEADMADADKDWTGAAQLYTQALALAPEDWGAREALAQIRYSQGDAAAAEAWMAPVLTWFPDSYPSLLLMSHIEEHLGKLSAAADDALAATRVPGERSAAEKVAVRLLKAAGRDDEAEALRRKRSDE